MGNVSNLSKTFRYVNSEGGEIIFEYAYGFLINKPVGIDTVVCKLNEAQGIDQTGTTVQSVNVQSRPVTISGILVGEFQAENKDKLLSVVRPDLYARLYADDYFLDVRPTATPTIEASSKFAAFQFSATAPYPYWQKEDSELAVLSGVEYGFKFPWNQSRAYRFGTAIRKQFLNVRNSGQVPVPFTLTFMALAEVKNPQIADASTGKFIRINKTLSAGERVVVEITHDRTYVTSSVDGECRGALELTSSLYRLAVGDNVLKPTAESGLDDLQVSIDFAPEIVGVTV
nr:MAG TPA: tail protein [Caudoviricetes sp.]